MDTYLIHYKNKGRLMTLDTRATSADQFGQIQKDFAYLARLGRPAKDVYDSFANMIRLYPECITPNGIPYHWGLAGPDGAWYELIAIPGITEEEITAAKEFIRRSFDVVRLSVLRIAKMI